MRSLLLTFLLVGCVGGDDSTTKDGGNDVTTTDGGNDVSTSDVVQNDAPDGGAWSPSAFGADLALWLVGDDVSDTAGAVDTWTDQSTYKTSPTQGVAASRPLHEKGTLNGHDVVDFNGNSVVLGIQPDSDAGTTPPNLSFGNSDDFVIASVVSTSTNMPPGWVWFKADSTCIGTCQLKDGMLFGVSLLNSVDQVGARESTADSFLTTNNAPMADHAFHVVAVRRIGNTQLQIRTDTVPKNATISDFDISEPTIGLSIGMAASGNLQGNFAFRMAELIAVHRTTGAINDADVTKIETYLKAKYKTP